MSAQIKALIQLECRNSTCTNNANKIGMKYNYYCMDHMRCGTKVTTTTRVCEGCLKTFQGEDPSIVDEMVIAETNNVLPEFIPIEINISPQVLPIPPLLISSPPPAPPIAMCHKLDKIVEEDEEDEEVSDDEEMTIYI